MIVTGRTYFAINRVGFNVGWDWLVPTERWHPLFLLPAGCILASEASPNRITMTRLCTRQGNRAALWISTTQIGCWPDWKLGLALSLLYIKYFLCHRFVGGHLLPCMQYRDVDYITVYKIFSKANLLSIETYTQKLEKNFSSIFNKRSVTIRYEQLSIYQLRKDFHARKITFRNILIR